MTYYCNYSEEFVKKLIKLKKKNKTHFLKLKNKINQIKENPNHNYKFLHNKLKGINRVHIGHFVLIFIINYRDKIISFEDYDHHDKIYL